MLEVNQLIKSFQSIGNQSTPVVRVESFSIHSGETLAMHGESGSGKTTFLNLLSGILSPDQGSISLNGTELCRLSENQKDIQRARTIGYVFQSFHLLKSCTALENVLLAMSFAGRVEREWAEEMLSRVGLKDRLHYKPGELSVGQQQRVALARSLVNRPVLLLADEPTGNLDSRNAQEVLEIMRNLCLENQASLLLVSHDEKIVSSFDRQVDWAELNQANPLSGVEEV
tara:strand:- start:7012 stop:7695 length:684 start_codon:yes stop_codon:yes gene_type:complete